MEKKNLTCLFVLSCLLLLFAQCSDSSDEDIKDMYLQYSSLFVKMGDINRSFNIQSGNGDYTTTWSDPDDPIITTNIVDNKVEVLPVKPGSGYLYVKDHKGKEASIQIFVEEAYLLFRPAEVLVTVDTEDELVTEEIQKDAEESQNLMINYYYQLYGVNENKGKVKVFQTMKDASGDNPKEEGIFTLDTEKPILSFQFANGLGTLEDTYAMIDATSANSNNISYLYSYFNIMIESTGFYNSTDTKSSNIAQTVYIALIQDVTEKYQAKYPDTEINSVQIATKTELLAYKYLVD